MHLGYLDLNASYAMPHAKMRYKPQTTESEEGLGVGWGLEADNIHQDDVPGLHALLQDAGDALLQLPPLLGSGYKQPNVQLQHTLVAQEGWDVTPPVVLALHDGIGQPLCNGRLALHHRLCF